MLIQNKNQCLFKKKLTIKLAGKLIDLASPMVMGIINVTPDSFYNGSRYQSEKDIVERAAKIIEEGGKFIDIGAYSTRPGAKAITVEEELNRLNPAVKAIRSNFPDMPLSLDTFRSEIAVRMVNEFG